MATALNLQSIYSLIEPELAAVRAEVLRHWTDAFRLVYGPSAPPPKLGGKLLRPALCLLSAGACGADRLQRFVPMAAAMELLHLAALAHDDVVDRADLRRGETSLNARWTNHIAVLGGDYLVARSLSVLTHYDRCNVVESALESIHQMAEGELLNFGKEHLDEEDCIRLAEKKTASLFAVSCATPTLLVDPQYREALHAYGMGLGTAFQLIDDLLDLSQDESTLGKPACGDIAEGKLTLPILYLRSALDDEGKVRLAQSTGSAIDPATRQWIQTSFTETGAKERVEILAREFANRAKEALERLSETPYREALSDAVDFVLTRDN